ncbi:MAG: oxalate/formate MFS antiporter [Proteobacteria bacterium]|nr:oxalate/formate MFS antiporter [Pseudomonadota bacterium]
METPVAKNGSIFQNPWLQLVLGVVCMAAVANLQYGWTLFVNPMDAKFHWGKPAIQVAFTIFVLTETWLVPIEGWLVDKYGPGIVVFCGGVLCGIAWAINSVADSLPIIYFAAAIGGIGAGAVYGSCVGNALKWFPGRRGLAAGFTAAGFGAGSALTVVPIANMIQSSGFQQAFLVFGIIQGVVVMVAALALRTYRGPTAAAAALAATKPQPVIGTRQSSRDFTPMEILRSPLFWVLYVMFVLMAGGGLTATAQLGPIAKDFGLNSTNVSLLGFTLPTLQFALTVDRLLNGVTRPISGWISDHLGRENTMCVLFAMEAIGIIFLNMYGRDPLLFVILSGTVFFAWGEIFSLFPATCGDAFGSKYAATNAGLLYTAKGTASLLVPLTSMIEAATGSWQTVFFLASGMSAIASLMAIFVLKPMLLKHVTVTRSETASDNRLLNPATAKASG